MAGLIEKEMPSQMEQDDDDIVASTFLRKSKQAPADDGPDESNPSFQAAMEMAMEALYGKGAANDVATQLKAAPDIVEGMANVAYEISSVVDERTDGEVPDELIVLLGMNILQEVADIAEAAGVAPKPRDVAESFKQMLLRFLGEQGLDTTQLQQAMDQVDPAMFDQAAEDGGEDVQAAEDAMSMGGEAEEEQV